MLESWIFTILRHWILIPILSVSGVAFALATQPAFDQSMMSTVVIASSVSNDTQSSHAPNDMNIVDMAEHCKNQNQNQCEHHYGSCIGCAIPPAKLAHLEIRHDDPEYSYLIKLVHPYLAQVLKPPRA